RRAIAPQRGRWTLPAGHLESGESAVDGAKREALEEAGARIDIGPVLGVYSEPEHSQVAIVYCAHLAEKHFAPGPESLEVGLFGFEDIPWQDLAFPADAAALRDFVAAPDRVLPAAAGAAAGDALS